MSLAPKRLRRLGAVAVVGIALTYWFPLFHVYRLDADSPAQSKASSQASPRASSDSNSLDSAVDPAALAEQLWERFRSDGESSVQVEELWRQMEADASAAREAHGRQVGLGGGWYFCVRGQGRVVEVDGDRCVLSTLTDHRQVVLHFGLVVGNTVRDTLGVDVNAFANSEGFNQVSAELNRRVEGEVIAKQRDALSVGKTVEFIGCGEIGSMSDLESIAFVPILVRVLEDTVP